MRLLSGYCKNLDQRYGHVEIIVVIDQKDDDKCTEFREHYKDLDCNERACMPYVQTIVS